MQAPRDRRFATLLTVMLSVMAAAVLGVIIYLTSTSLPYLALFPSGDSTFGTVNACLLDAVPRRTGFTVAPDGRVAAWNAEALAVCTPRGERSTPAFNSIASAAFDASGSLWVLAGSPASLTLLDSAGRHDLGSLSAVRMVGTAEGLVTLDQAGELRSIHRDGSVGGVAHIPAAAVERASLTASAGGTRVATVWGGGMLISDAATLRQVRAEAPCEIAWLWWLSAGDRVTVEYAAEADLALTINVDSGEQSAAPHRSRVRSTLMGPPGTWVTPCDALPCTAEPP